MGMIDQIAEAISKSAEFDPYHFDLEVAADAVVGLLRQGPTVTAVQCGFRPDCARLEDRHDNGIHDVAQAPGTYALVLLPEEE